jgi:hypothetical protein
MSLSRAMDDFCITLFSKFRYGEKLYVLAGDINYTEVPQACKKLRLFLNLVWEVRK